MFVSQVFSDGAGNGRGCLSARVFLVVEARRLSDVGKAALRDQQLSVILRVALTSQLLHAHRLRCHRGVANVRPVVFVHQRASLALLSTGRLLSVVMLCSVYTVVGFAKTIT